jgi:hypothetical protein
MGPRDDADQECDEITPQATGVSTSCFVTPERWGSYIIPLLRSWRKDASGMADIGG